MPCPIVLEGNLYIIVERRDSAMTDSCWLDNDNLASILARLLRVRRRHDWREHDVGRVRITVEELGEP